jgi:copper transport protein
MSTRSRLMVVLAASAVGLVALAGVAGAHASLSSSDPADGALLQSSPSQVTLTFTERPDPSLTIVHVLDSTGAQVESGPAEPVPGQPVQIREPVGTLPKGVYTVTWRTVSEADGHVTAGAFSFGVGVSPAGAPAPSGGVVAQTPSPSPLSVAGRWALYVGLSVMLAFGSTGLIAFGGRLPRRRSVLIGASILAAAGAVAMTVAERSVVGVPLGTLLGSSAGGKFVWLLVAVAVATVLGIVAALLGGRTLSILVAVAAAGALLARALGGHASGAGLAAFNVGLQWIHLLGVGVWIGGLVWLALVVRSDTDAERGGEVRTFSLLAGAGLGAVAITGTLRAVDVLGGWAALLHVFSTSYGTTLAIKVSLAVVLIGLGTFNHYVNVPRYASSGRAVLRRLAGAELVLAAGVFALTGVLTGLPPASEARAPVSQAAKPLVVNGSDFATTTRVRLQVTPGTIGPNRFVADVTDYDTGQPVDADRVSLTFSLPGQPDVGSTLALKHQADGTWAAQSTALAIDGRWEVLALVENASGSTQVSLTLTPRAPPQQVSVSRVAGQPDLYTITLAGGVQIQSYVDPGTLGTNQLHVTAFDASGNELPLGSISVHAESPSSTDMLDMQRFSAGHFVANLDIVPGPWRFLISATAKDGSNLTASFQQTFGG